MDLAMEKKDEHVCALCCQDTHIFAVGKCDHPVCYLCSTKMRVLCKQKHCAVCRVELDKVVFVQELQPFAALNDHVYQTEKTHGIYFASGRIFAEFRKIFHSKCLQCPKSKAFSIFEHLEQHMQRQHNLFCCELCVRYLKLFPSERKWYTPEELARHQTQGDAGDTSLRGHPLCTLCNTRHLDEEELRKHLKQNHYSCQFCGADRVEDFYCEYHNLCKHFRERHFLCEEGFCSQQQFTNAFRTETAYRAHKAAAHSKNQAKAQQNRGIFNYAPHQVPDLQNEDAFPGLGHCGTKGSAPNTRSYADAAKNYFREEDFPALTPQKPQGNKPSVWPQIRNNRFVPEDFPTLTPRKPQGNKAPVWPQVRNYPAVPEDFPALTPRKPQGNKASVWSQVRDNPAVLSSEVVVLPQKAKVHSAPVFSSPVPLGCAPRRRRKCGLAKTKSPVSSDDRNPQTGNMVQKICAAPTPSDISSPLTVKSLRTKHKDKKGTSANRQKWDVEMVITVAPNSNGIIKEYEEKPKDAKDSVFPEEPPVPTVQPVPEPPAVPEEENVHAPITGVPLTSKGAEARPSFLRKFLGRLKKICLFVCK